MLRGGGPWPFSLGEGVRAVAGLADVEEMDADGAVCRRRKDGDGLAVRERGGGN